MSDGTNGHVPSKPAFMAIIAFGRSGSTMLQYALNQSPGVLIRGENYNLPFGAYLIHSTAKRATRVYSGKLPPENPWYGAPDIPLDRVLSAQRELVSNCLLRPETDTILCGWKEIRHTPWSEHFPKHDQRFIPRDFDELLEYLLFLDELLPGIRFLVNTRNPDTACHSSWWAQNPSLWREVLQTSHDWLHAVPEALYGKLGRKAAVAVRYEDWTSDPSGLEEAWKFLNLPWERERMSEIFKHRVNGTG